MSPFLIILSCAAASVILGLLTRRRAPRLGFDFTEAGRVSEACSACDHPCDTAERSDVTH